MSQLQYWVWLSMRFGVRPKVKLALVEHFGTPRDVYFATEADYRVRVPLRPEELRLLQDKDCAMPTARSPSATGSTSAS